MYANVKYHKKNITYRPLLRYLNLKQSEIIATNVKLYARPFLKFITFYNSVVNNKDQQQQTMYQFFYRQMTTTVTVQQDNTKKMFWA